MNTLWRKYFLTAITMAIIVTPGMASTPESSRVPAPAFRPVLSTLIGHTTIPILLPSWLPAGTTGRWCGGDADEDYYHVWLPSKAEVLEHAPHNSESVDAQRIGPKTPAEEGVPVALSGGRVGYFQASEWNARPTEAWLDWSEHGVRYTLGEYNGTKADLVHMANSMVVVGGGLPPLLRRAVPKLRATGIRPVLLPTYLPPLEGYLAGRKDIKPIMDVIAEATNYQVAYSSRPDVDEADMAYFQADPLNQYSGALPGVPVTLWMPNFALGGGRSLKVPVRAGFQAVEPGRTDSSALIAWDMGKVRYTLIWLGGSRMQMIRMAESCVPMTFSARSGRQPRAETP